ncbi:hypothetical protein AAG906_018881 [Vitis piasezkii]
MCFWRSLNEAKLDKILEACESNGMKELLSIHNVSDNSNRAIQFIADYGLPKSVRSLSGPIFNKAGALTPCRY